jgi:hypothetical protein
MDTTSVPSGPRGPRRSRAHRPRIITVSLGIVLAAALPVTTSAENWGAAQSTPGYSNLCTDWDDGEDIYPGSECTANNSVHSVYLPTTMHPNLRNALVNSLQDDYDPLPDVWAYEDTSPDSLTDVLVYYFTEDASIDIAFTTCSEFASTSLYGIRYHMSCTPQHIVFQTYPKATTCWGDKYCRRHYACHELGHTLGLQHTSDINNPDSCMSYSPTDPGVLRNHDEEHLIDCYPHPTPPLPAYDAETRTTLCKDNQ